MPCENSCRLNKDVRQCYGPLPIFDAKSMINPPRDNDASRFPVSVKGVIIRGGKVILLRNERSEWELPGGKLELSESPERCLAREIAEELRLEVVPESILSPWIYTIVTKPF